MKPVHCRGLVDTGFFPPWGMHSRCPQALWSVSFASLGRDASGFWHVEKYAFLEMSQGKEEPLEETTTTQTRSTVRGEACAKAILFGEHAVVYHRPAIAVPIPHLKVTATVNLKPEEPGVLIATDIDRRVEFADEENRTYLARVLRLIVSMLGMESLPWSIELTSRIPIGGGMGSSAAVSMAILRALATALGKSFTPEEISKMVYRTEQLYHGSPSGIDNTVIALEKPVWFLYGTKPEVIAVRRPFTLVLGHTGRHSPTREVVASVQYGWRDDPERYEVIFDEIASVTRQARQYLERGQIERLGDLMNKNHSLLKSIGVSSGPLERLINAARRAGALGAKLTGAGRGGMMIALVTQDRLEAVKSALWNARAKGVYVTTVEATYEPRRNRHERFYRRN